MRTRCCTSDTSVSDGCWSEVAGSWRRDLGTSITSPDYLAVCIDAQIGSVQAVEDGGLLTNSRSLDHLYDGVDLRAECDADENHSG